MDPPGQLKSNFRLRVLIADDVAETRRAMRIMLSLDQNVVVVGAAENGQQAVELARTHQPDIILMDLNMPVMSGLDAMKAILAENSGTICVVVSTEQDSQTLYDAMAAGAREYLIKPFTVGKLEQVLLKMRKLIEERQHLAKKAAKKRHNTITRLKRQAVEVITKRRTDEEAVQILEGLAKQPRVELSWLMHLGMLYILRKEWGKLKDLAERLEAQEKDRYSS
jgi:YesN/AraC family two-component response regulator